MEEDKDVEKKPNWQLMAFLAAVVAVILAGILYNNARKSLNPANGFPVNNQVQTVSPVINEAQKKGEEVSVFLTPTGFVPTSLTVNAGTKVIWVNQSGVAGYIASAPHPAHTDFPPLNLGSFESGQSLSLVFSTPGTYKYHNHLQPTQAASVTVK